MLDFYLNQTLTSFPGGREEGLKMIIWRDFGRRSIAQPMNQKPMRKERIDEKGQIIVLKKKYAALNCSAWPPIVDLATYSCLPHC